MAELSKILVVDDDEDISMITKMSLEDVGGYEVLVCNSGQTAIDQVVDFKPDMILLDYMMPEMDGAATLVKFKEMEAVKNVPVVFLTAKVQKHEIEAYMDQGVVGVLAKPYNPISLPEEILSIWKNVGLQDN